MMGVSAAIAGGVDKGAASAELPLAAAVISTAKGNVKIIRRIPRSPLFAAAR